MTHNMFTVYFLEAELLQHTTEFLEGAISQFKNKSNILSFFNIKTEQHFLSLHVVKMYVRNGINEIIKCLLAKTSFHILYNGHILINSTVNGFIDYLNQWWKSCILDIQNKKIGSVLQNHMYLPYLSNILIFWEKYA